jgi:hypothetical protein
MHSTRPGVLRAAPKTLACALLAAALMFQFALPAGAAARGTHRVTCADRLCKRDVPRTPSCYRLHGRTEVARCFIARAADQYRQSKSQAFYIAWRESRYNWRATNPSSGTAGLYQFAWQTWRSTPYRHYSPYNPRWASLAAMWMWAHGGYSHWGM